MAIVWSAPFATIAAPPLTVAIVGGVPVAPATGAPRSAEATAIDDAPQRVSAVLNHPTG